MMLGVVVLAGLLAYQTSGPVQVSPLSEHSRASALEAPDAEALKASLEKEVRDAPWASRTEERLRLAYQEIDVTLETVNCGATLCEAVASIDRLAAVQSQPMMRMVMRLRSASALKLVHSNADIVRTDDETASPQDQFTLKSYWQRLD